MEPIFYIELALSLGSIAVLSWKIAGWTEETPAAASSVAGSPAVAADPAQEALFVASRAVAPPAAAPVEVDYMRIRWALASEQLPIRLAAVAELALLPGAEPVQILAGLLRDPHYEIRRLAVQRLGAEKDAGHTEALLQAARDVRIEVQNAACEALVGNRDPRVRELFRRMALQGLQYARVLGIRGLGAAGGEDKLLVELVRNSTGRVRDEGIVALSGSGEPEALEVVRDYLKAKIASNDPAPAREPIDEGQFRQVLDQEPSMPLIEEVESGLQGLSALRRKGEVLARLGAIAHDRAADERRRYLAVRGMAFLGGSPLLAKLEELARDEVTAVRFGAVIGIGKLRSSKALPALRSALADASFLVRGAALIFLSQLGNAVERTLFEAATHDADEFIRTLANQALAARRPDPDRLTEADLGFERAPAPPAPEPAVQAVTAQATPVERLGVVAFIGAELDEAVTPHAMPVEPSPEFAAAPPVLAPAAAAPVAAPVSPMSAIVPPVSQAASGVRPALWPARPALHSSAPASMVRALLARSPHPPQDRALEKLLQPLRTAPRTLAPAAPRLNRGDRRRMTLSEVLRGA